MSGHVTVVTGAAGGIGQAVVRALTSDGHAVAAIDARAEALEAAAKELGDAGHDVRSLVADVTSASEVEAVVDRVEQEMGPIDGLANAAGILRVSEACELEESDWEQTMAVNATGVFLMSRAVARRMKPRRAGSIVTVTSNAAQVPRWGMAAYAASKAAATSFTKCLGLELARDGIRCNTVAPGSTHTPMLTSLWGDERDALETSVQGAPDRFRVGIPLGRVAQPDDVAGAVAFLLSREAAYITLQALTIDGGSGLGA
jgi:2,3-dihydro-2,3-dihydroxybenzoate dehydrogenase